MTRHLNASSALLLAMAALPLGGCITSNPGMESIKQPVVSRTDYVFDVATGGAASLSPGEAQRLAGWFETIGLRYGDRVGIDDRSGLNSELTRSEVAAVASRWGIDVAPTAGPTAGEVAAGAVRVVVSRTTATVPGCPDWSGAPYPDFTASTTSNYGCATNRNLAAMVADPEDLVRGREPGRSVDANPSKALKMHRDRTPTGFQDGLRRESTGGGGN